MKQQPPKSHSHLKQRIVGAVVLIAVIIIFAPMLTRHQALNVTSFSNLAEKPDVEKANFKTAQDFTKAASMPAKTAEPVTKAWVVQLGTFSQKNRAEMLVKRLQAQGYASYTYDVAQGSKQYTRVYVGPEIQRTKAEALKKDLADKYKLQGRIVPFNPLTS